MCRALAPVVVDGDPGRAPDRVGQGAEVGDRLTPVEPVAGIEMEALDQARGADPQFGRQRREDLELRAGHDRPESELGGGPGHPGQEERLGFLAGHPGQSGPVPVDEADPAMRAAFGVDRDTGRAQRLDITMDRALGDLELGGELAGGQLARVPGAGAAPRRVGRRARPHDSVIPARRCHVRRPEGLAKDAQLQIWPENVSHLEGSPL